MVSVRWGLGPAQMAIHPWWQVRKAPPPLSPGQHPDYEWAPIEICGRDHGIGVLGRGQAQAQPLRQLLTGVGDVNVSRLSDLQVITHVSDQLAQRRWILFKLVLTAEARAKFPCRAVAAPAPVRQQASSPSSFKERQADAPSTKPALAIVEADFESVDQDAQAATLRLAAVTGVPFCAICEKLKRERERERAASLQEAT